MPAAVAVQEVVREIIPDIPDDEYFESLDPDEIDCYKKVEFTFDTNLHCTTCFRQVPHQLCKSRCSIPVSPVIHQLIDLRLHTRSGE